MNSISETMKFSNKINVNFSGGQLTSDSGLILYHEFDEVFGFSSIVRVFDSSSFNKYCQSRIIAGFFMSNYQKALLYVLYAVVLCVIIGI